MALRLFNREENRPLNILIVTDCEWNLQAEALAGLTGHEVMTASDGRSSFVAVDNKGIAWDAWLVDLYTSRQFEYLSKVKLNGEADFIPAGLVFALVAAMRDIPVAICTDADSKEDPIVSLFSGLCQLGVPGIRKIRLLQKCRYCHEFHIPTNQVVKVNHDAPSGGLIIESLKEGMIKRVSAKRAGKYIRRKLRKVRDWGSCLERLLDDR